MEVHGCYDVKLSGEQWVMKVRECYLWSFTDLVISCGPNANNLDKMTHEVVKVTN